MLREAMALRKKEYSRTTLSELSQQIMDKLEQTDAFKKANCIALYHAIAGEVQTADFIEKWYEKKKILLPVIEGNDLRLLPYTGKGSLRSGIFGILEPATPDKEEKVIDEKDIDLIIVPGVAFDRLHNRMGRGKGYYDRLLSTLSALKIGICFDFQLQNEIPVEPFDKKMDYIITENEVI